MQKNNNKICTIFRICLFSFLCSTVAVAARPNIDTVIKDSKIKKPFVEEKILPRVEVPDPINPSSGTGTNQLLKVFIKKFSINGNENIPTEQLQALLEPYLERTLSFSDLQNIASSVTIYYRNYGYFAARAYLPTQDITNGIIEVMVVEGKYGEFRLTNNSYVRNFVIQNMLEETRIPVEAINSKSIEKTMLVLSKLPGMEVKKIDIAPSEKVGYGDFIVDVEKKKRVSGYIMFDNYGSSSTGKLRNNISVDINSPFGIGDKIGLSNLVSESFGTENRRISYEFPADLNGARLELAYTSTDYALGREYASLKASGDSSGVEMHYMRPLFETKQKSFMLDITAKDSSMQDTKSETTDNKDITSIVVALTYADIFNIYGYPLQATNAFSFTAGKINLGPTLLATDKAGAQTNGNYSKIHWSSNATLYLTQSFSLKGSLELQKALENKNLDGSEDLSIGGNQGVRAYPGGEASAENGYLVGVDLMYALPQYNSIFSLFFDVGEVNMEDPLSTYTKTRLQDIGIAYSFIYQQNISFKTQIAKAINPISQINSEGNDVNAPKIWMQLFVTF